MTRNFCTIFDSNYLAKGVAMIRSLKRHSPSAVVYVLAMDKECEYVLRGNTINLGIVVVSMKTFELITGLGELRKTRTHQEYCWTVGSVFAEFVFQNIEGVVKEGLTYIDADCFFFSDPEPVFAEIGDKSIGITPHRFAKKDEARLLPNGKYAVQWVTFKGEVGRRALSKWAGQVREWCFYSHSDGRFADQKYLDTWVTDYPGEVCEIANPGVGLAPWNIANYTLRASYGEDVPHVLIDTESPGTWDILVMYHFHEYIHGERLTGWKLRESDKELIYAPYAEAIEEANELIASVHLQSR